MSAGKWVSDHPWMTFFLASAAITGVSRVLAPRSSLDAYGVEMAPSVDLPKGWNDVAETMRFEPMDITAKFTPPPAYRKPTNWTLVAGLGLLGAAAAYAVLK